MAKPAAEARNEKQGLKATPQREAGERNIGGGGGGGSGNNNPASGAWGNYIANKRRNEDAMADIRQSFQPDVFQPQVPQSTVTRVQGLIDDAARKNVFNQINQATMPVPAWMKSGIGNTRTNPVGQATTGVEGAPSPTVRTPAWLGGAGNVEPATPNYTGTGGYWGMHNAMSNPATMHNNYVGVPVNDSYSDTLRSMTPPTRGGAPTLSDYLRSLQAQIPYADPSYYGGGNGGSGGFGSSYGGNWRKGGGGGGGGGGGWGNDGYGRDTGYGNPAWNEDQMGLYSWKFG